MPAVDVGSPFGLRLVPSRQLAGLMRRAQNSRRDVPKGQGKNKFTLVEHRWAGDSPATGVCTFDAKILRMCVVQAVLLAADFQVGFLC